MLHKYPTLLPWNLHTPSSGRGMQNGENFALLNGIADKLGAAISASRGLRTFIIKTGLTFYNIQR